MVNKGQQMAILKFYTNSCEPCALLTNTLTKGGIETTNIDAKANTDLVAEHGIRTVPTLVDTRTGQKLVGLKSIIEINAWIKQCDQIEN